MKFNRDRIVKNRFVQDSFWALSGNVIAKGMSLVATILVARFLGKEIYGEFGTIKSTLMNFAIFSTFGLGYTATKYFAELKLSQPNVLKQLANQALKITFIVSGIMAMLLFFFSNFIAATVLQAEHLSVALQLFAIWIVFNALTTTQIGILSGLGAFKKMAKINALVGFISFTSSICLAYYYGLNGALGALLLTQIFNWYINLKAVNSLVPKEGETLDYQFKNKLLRFSFPIALQELTYALSSWVLILLLIEFGNYGEVGLYTAAVQWSIVILFIPGILRNVILTHLSENLNNSSRYSKVLYGTLMINLLATLIPFLILFVLSSWIVGFYGESFEGLRTVLLIIAFSTIFISLSNVYSQAFMSLNKNWLMFKIRLLRDVLVILLFTILCYNYNKIAVNLCTSILIVNVIFLIVMFISYKSIQIKDA